MFAVILLQSAALTMPLPDGAQATAIQKGVHRLEAAAANYVTNRSCFSCHHQSVPLLALSAAGERGFKVDKKLVADQGEFTRKFFGDKLKDLKEARGMGGGPTTAVYGLLALKAAGTPRSDAADALVEWLLKKQSNEGTWPATNNRPPSQGSVFTNTALAVDALTRCLDSDDEDLIERCSQAKDKAIRKLLDTKRTSTEDRVFLLWALVVGKANPEDIAKAKEDLLKQQRPNGGWAQLDAMGTDAYATGTALTALAMAGVSPDEPAYRKGVKYLVTTQLDSGGWIVNTRSRPVQTYFDNGDPGGKSQFISTAAAGWAVRALLEGQKR